MARVTYRNQPVDALVFPIIRDQVEVMHFDRDVFTSLELRATKTAVPLEDLPPDLLEVAPAGDTTRLAART